MNQNQVPTPVVCSNLLIGTVHHHREETFVITARIREYNSFIYLFALKPQHLTNVSDLYIYTHKNILNTGQIYFVG